MAADLTLQPPPARRRRRWLWPLACLATTVCLAVFLRDIDWRALWRQVAAADPLWLLVAMAANFVTLPLMTEQWARLLPTRPAGRWRTLWNCVTISMASMNTLPLGGGHAVAVGLIAGRGITSVEGGVSLLALEQICEGFARATLLVLALALAPLPPALKRAMEISTGAIVVAFIVLLWVAQATPHSERGWRARWAAHLAVLRQPRGFIYATALSVAMKAFGLVAIYAVERSLGVQLPLGATVLALAAVTFATSVAVSPGSVGVYELAAIAAFRLSGVEAAPAAALGLLLHVSFLVPIVAPGYATMLGNAIAAWRRGRVENTGPVA